jgi:filamentous hemagglutinin family protein
MGNAKGLIGLALLPVSSGLMVTAAQAEPQTVRIDAQANAPILAAPEFSTGTQVRVEGDRTTIGGGTQVDQNLFHRFDRFNLNAGQIATFLTQPQTRAVFSQILGGNASYIDGLLQVQGSAASLYVINPSGILFGPNARLDLGGSFLATTADRLGFADNRWINVLTGQTSGAALTGLGFSAAEPGSVVNQGILAVGPGQALRLVGGNVVNEGSLIATGGEVSAIAVPGQSQVQFGDVGGLLSLSIAPQSGPADPAIFALNPQSLPHLLAGQPNTEATQLEHHTDGSIALVNRVNQALISGRIDVSANPAGPADRGGQVTVIGETVRLANATIEALGTKGGTIRIGGEYQGGTGLPGSTVTTVDRDSILRADAVGSGPLLSPEGGQIIVWSNGQTQFAGTATARGLSAGGLVETSGKQTLNVAGARVDASSAQGIAGEWLLDPSDITIATGGPGVLDEGGQFDPGPVSTIAPETIETALDNGTSVTITTAGGSGGNGDITLANSINQIGGGGAQLTITGRRFNRSGTAQINLTSTGAITFNLNAVNPEFTPPAASIQNVIDAIGTGSGVRQINLRPGAYQGAAGTNLVTIDKTVTINGDASSRPQIDGQNSSRNIWIKPGTTAILRNLEIVNGFTPSTESGAGILNEGRLTLDNIFASNNKAGLNGGGIDSSKSTSGLTVTGNTVFVDNRAGLNGGGLLVNGNTQFISGAVGRNQASNNGGGIYNIGNLVLDQVGIFSNSALQGGGIYSGGAGSQVAISSFSVNNNSATEGAGLFNQDGTITLTTGSFSLNQATTIGGAIRSSGGLMDMEFTSFTNNQAGTLGGGLWLNNVAATIDIGYFADNSAANSGGAIAGLNGTLSIQQTILTNNSANVGGALQQTGGQVSIVDSQFLTNEGLGGGGAIDLFGVTNSSIQRTLVQGNRSKAVGGGIRLGGPTSLTLERVTLDGNEGGTGGGLGGDFGRNFSGLLTINSSVISNNNATANGGGIDINPIAIGGIINLNNTTVSQNRSAVDGGGISFSSRATLNIINSTLSENKADDDAGAIAAFGILNINHSTIAENVADADSNLIGIGGGLFDPNAGSQSRVTNTIIAQNRAFDGADVSGDFIDQGNNLIGIQDGSTGFSNSALVGTAAAPINPRLAPLGNYGGLTQTMALLPGSDAIDAGNSTILRDQRGIARVNAPDIGAFESRGFVLTPLAGMSQTTAVNTAFSTPLSVAIASPFGEPIDGATLTFVVPTTGATALFLTSPIGVPIDSTGAAQLSFMANGITGNYDVLATSKGLTPVALALTNSPAPIVPPIPIPPIPIPPIPIPPIPIPPNPIPPNPIPPTPTSPEVIPTQPVPSISNTAPIATPALFNPALSISDQVLTSPDFSASTTNTESALSLVDGNAIAQIDEQLSAEYSTYWGRQNGKGSTIPDTQALLRQAEASHQTRSAVIYALFVPKGKSDLNATAFGNQQSARLALNQRLKTATVRDDDQLLLVLVPSAGPPVQKLIPVSRAEVLQQAKLFRLAVSDPEDDRSYRPLAQQMYQWLFAPVEPDVQTLQLNNVMYIVDAGLRTIPLAAMMEGDRFIVERYGLSIIPSVNLLETSLGQSAPPPRILAAGANQFAQLESLPAVSLELEAIAKSQQSTQVLLNESFTQSNLVSTRRQTQASMLHLATHAEFNAGDLASSYLQFWDSQLTFDQIRSLGGDELELLILSACATAISSPQAELGFAGLASATGVESTIGSLWNVSDIGTLALMSEFYGHLSQSPLRVEALRRSQLSLLSGNTKLTHQSLSTTQGEIPLGSQLGETGETDFRHPFYWSGFSLVGNPWW